eukprot:5510760-Pleurochrysis_carterae.AAC.1
MFPEPPPWHPDDLESELISTPTSEHCLSISASHEDTSATPTQSVDAEDNTSGDKPACATTDAA